MRHLALAIALLMVAAPARAAADLDALWHDATLWEVGSNTAKVPAARKALVAEGERAVGFLVPGKLDTKDTLITRALQVVLSGVGRPAVAPLVAALGSEVANVRRNAADLLGTLGATDAAPAIARLLQDDDTRMGALSALGALKARSAEPEVAGVLDSAAPERARVAAAAALGSIGGDAAVQVLARDLADHAAPVRFAAQAALEQLHATAVLRTLARDGDHRVKLHALSALAHLAEPAARAEVLPLLGDHDALVRGYAAEALAAIARPQDEPMLRRKAAAEGDPFARGKLEAALEASRRAPAVAPLATKTPTQDARPAAAH